jgi:CBS domain-containing protein
MTGGALVTVPPKGPVEDAIRAMKRAAVRRALVTDETGRLLGVVATADLLREADAIGHDWLEALVEALAEPAALHR